MKKKKYAHLTIKERDRIQALLSNNHKQKEIAEILNVDKSTISREIQRNRRKKYKKRKIINGPYVSTVADHKAYVRRLYSKYQGKKINENKPLRNYIIRGLIRCWSPDETSGRMKETKQPFYASKTAIYEWLYSVYGQRYCQYLYSKNYRPNKQNKNKTKKTLIPNRVSIESRPNGAKNRTRYGHYEGDTMVSGKKTGSRTSLSVIYERKAKYIDARKISNLKPETNNQAIIQMMERLKANSLTFDNGIENTKHEQLNLDTFFCDAYSAWQKGGVENGIKMIRRFVLKGTDVDNYSDDYVRMVISILNNKPRKSLNYQTPLEVMMENNRFKTIDEINLNSSINLLIINSKTTNPEVALRG